MCVHVHQINFINQLSNKQFNRISFVFVTFTYFHSVTKSNAFDSVASEQRLNLSKYQQQQQKEQTISKRKTTTHIQNTRRDKHEPYCICIDYGAHFVVGGIAVAVAVVVARSVNVWCARVPLVCFMRHGRFK